MDTLTKEPVLKNPYQDISIKKSAQVLRALNHSLRQEILQTIGERGRITVTELYVKLKLEQSVASQHLAILRKQNFVTTKRDGKQIYYSVNNDRVHNVIDLARKIIHVDAY